MLRASFEEVIGGRRVLFALPLAALRRIAEIQPRLYDLGLRLARNEVSLAEVEAVLTAAADADAARHVIEQAGLVGATERAARILFLALTDELPAADPGNGKAAAAPTTATPRHSTGAPMSALAP